MFIVVMLAITPKLRGMCQKHFSTTIFREALYWCLIRSIKITWPMTFKVLLYTYPRDYFVLWSKGLKICNTRVALVKVYCGALNLYFSIYKFYLFTTGKNVRVHNTKCYLYFFELTRACNGTECWHVFNILIHLSILSFIFAF